MRILIAALLVASACAESPPSTPRPNTVPPVASLAPAAWLAGRWVAHHEGALVEESWSTAQGASMIGAMRVLEQGKPVFYELLVLEDEGGVAKLRMAHYRPGLAPTDKGPLTYALAAGGGDTLAFDVVGDDRVRRITYAKTPAGMTVRLERGDGGAEELRFERAR